MDEITMDEITLKEGKESTEWSLTKGFMVAGIILAIASSLGKVPFTPDQASAYLANVIAEASKWAKVFAPYMTALAGWYIHVRTSLKKKHLDAQVKLATQKGEK